MSWEKFFQQNEKLIKHIDSQLKDTVYTPAHSEIFDIFKRVPFDKVKVVIIGDKPYNDPYTASGIAFSSKDNFDTTILLKRMYEELENSITKFKPPTNNQLEKWLEEGIFLCNFCFTCPLDDYKFKKSYYLLWEPFINNLVSYISENTSAIFMLVGYRASTLRSSINEINCSIIEVPHPIYNYEKFKGCNCFQQARQLAGDLGFTINWDLS